MAYSQVKYKTKVGVLFIALNFGHRLFFATKVAC